jgi:hypothetical protein
MHNVAISFHIVAGRRDNAQFNVAFRMTTPGRIAWDHKLFIEFVLMKNFFVLKACAVGLAAPSIF